MARFVILYHEFPAGHARPPHWDFMLEERDSLRTWALPRRPGRAGPMLADALADHRLEYLEYEGPVSRGRGTVSQWDSGTFVKKREEPGGLTLTLTGKRLRGDVELTPVAGAQRRWRFAFVASRTATSD